VGSYGFESQFQTYATKEEAIKAFEQKFRDKTKVAHCTRTRTRTRTRNTQHATRNTQHATRNTQHAHATLRHAIAHLAI
jgi:uncharacterized ferritin-like protein (DUF455 family)